MAEGADLILQGNRSLQAVRRRPQNAANGLYIALVTQIPSVIALAWVA